MMRRMSLIWLIMIAFSIVGCKKSDTSPPGEASKDGQQKVSLMLNWYPEAEHGGFYAALVHGYYEEAGLDVEIRPGGRTAPVAQEMAIGRVQFGIGNADDVLLARQEGADVVALMAPLQNTPRCIMVREDSGITRLEDLKGLTLQLGTGRPFVDYMRARGLLEGVKVVPYSGSVSQLVTSKDVAQQAYNFSEPLMAEQAGVAVRTLMVSDIGFNPYASVLMATNSMINDNPELCRKFVAASIRGWQKYLESPDETNAYILSQNKEGMTAEALAYGVEKMKPLCLPEGIDTSMVGQMSEQRWKELVDQLVELKVVDADKVKVADTFTLEFLEKK